ncbi:MAG: transporter substrate-binding domain-containing protein, partial [bacterium]|nr:transporter substrate-binding domain-containing protein [bacterium]
MKKLVFYLVFLVFATPVFAQTTMQIVYFDTYAPFSWKEDGKMKGILIDVLTEAIQNRIGIPLSHNGYPWVRAQKMVKHGLADAFATVPTDERRSYTKISNEPVVLATFTLFVNKKNSKLNEIRKVKTFSDLKPFKLGQYLGSGWAKKNLEGLDVIWVRNLE